MDELTGVFVQESREQLAEMEAGLLALEADPEDASDINAIFRAAHTIKGGADHWGARQTYDLALRIERLCRDQKLDEARLLRAALARSIADLLPDVRAFAAGP